MCGLPAGQAWPPLAAIGGIFQGVAAAKLMLTALIATASAGALFREVLRTTANRLR